MAAVWDWFTEILAYMGIWSKEAKILFLGLDNAGKTTMLHMLKSDKLKQFEGTIHAGKEELQIGSVVCTAHDLGGHETARKVWPTYFDEVDAVIYIVDAADQERIPESKKELDELLNTPSLMNVPFLVLGNKADKRDAYREQELRAMLGLTQTTGKEATSRVEGVRPLELYMCSVVKKWGYDKGLAWLMNFMLMNEALCGVSELHSALCKTPTESQ